MSVQPTPDPHRPGLRVRAAATPANKGYAGLLKLLLAAAGLVLLASYIGRAKPDAENETAPAPRVEDMQTIAQPQPAAQAPKPTLPASIEDARFSVSAGGRALRITGDVGRNFAEDLRQVLQANPYLQRIDITSGGGYAGSGLEAARLIRQYNLIVRVRSHCASMCVGLWAAAGRREMEPDAMIGLHQWNTRCDALPQPQRDECAYAAQFWFEHDTVYDGWLRSAGFSERLIGLQEQTPSDDIAALNVLQLRAEGVDFSVVDAEGKVMDMDEVRQFLAAKYGRR